MVFLVSLEVLRQVIDALREEGDLDFRRPRVFLVDPIRFDSRFLLG
jgi:hypothetical protein